MGVGVPERVNTREYVHYVCFVSFGLASTNELHAQSHDSEFDEGIFEYM